MAARAPAGHVGSDRPARLNPFAFPSDTDFRFVLLIVSVLGSSLLLYAGIYEAVPASREYRQSQYDWCTQQADPTDMSGSYAERAARVLLFGQCTSAVDRQEATCMFGGVLLVLILAAVMYWTFPLRRVRRDRLIAIDESTPGVAACLKETHGATDLPFRPTFLWNPLNAARSGLAFGRLGQYYVALTGGLVTQIYSDRPAFRAVVLHELAHLRNADVDRTYFTNALWQAFLVAALLPFAASQVVSGRSAAEIASLSWRILPLIAMVYLTRNAVLRAREVYADVRASTWDGPSGALRRTLGALPRPARGWSALWQLHPDPTARLSFLDDTRQLFRIHLWEAFGTGVAAGITLPNIVVPLGLVVPMPVAIVRPLAAALVCAALAVGVVGLAVWRATFAAVAEGRPSSGAGRAGIALAAGLALGQELSLAAVEFGRGLGPVADLPVAALNVAWGALLACVLFVFFRWIAASASTWLEVTVDDPSPDRAYRVGLCVAGALLAAWLGVLFFIYLAARTGGNAFTWSDLQTETRSEAAMPLGTDAALAPLAQTGVAMLVGLDLLALASLLAFFGYPLAAWLWRHRGAAPTMAAWAFLDSPTPIVELPKQAPLRPGRAAAIALVGGVVYCALTFLVFSALFEIRSGSATWSETVAAWTEFGTVALAVIVQVVVAMAVAAWQRRLPALHALFAAFVAGCAMSCGTMVILARFDLLLDDWLLMLLFASVFIILGACAAGPLAVIASSVGARFRGPS
jgi:Peptidase family M48